MSALVCTVQEGRGRSSDGANVCVRCKEPFIRSPVIDRGTATLLETYGHDDEEYADIAVAEYLR